MQSNNDFLLNNLYIDIYMDYYNKYIKYKTKYLELKYDNNQYGGDVVPCNKAYKSLLNTCWAVALQMILSFGDLTSSELNEVMKTFKHSDNTVDEIIKNIDAFIDNKIDTIRKNLKLYDFLPEYIFDEPKVTFLKTMLKKFIYRYYSKVFEFNLTTKPPEITDDKQNPERCELAIVQNYRQLFDYYIIKYQLSKNTTMSILDSYLFCNLISIFFLNYKVSFKTYYDNFNLIKFDDDTDLGILIMIKKHICCLFICNGITRFYNDNDKKIYNCDWKTILAKSTNDLYVDRNGCLIVINDINAYTGNKTKVSKVLYLTVISKYIDIDTTVDSDIKRALTLTDIDNINEPSIQTTLGYMFYDYKKYTDAFKFLTRAINQNYTHAGLKLADMWYNQPITKKFTITDKFRKVRTLLNRCISLGNIEAMIQLGKIYEDGNIVHKNVINAFTLYNTAIKNGDTSLYAKIGDMYKDGIGVKQNLLRAFNLYNKALENGDKSVHVKIEDMYKNGIDVTQLNKHICIPNQEGIYKTLINCNKDKLDYVKLGNMYENGDGVKKDYNKAFNYYMEGLKNGDNNAHFYLGNMYENGLGITADPTEAYGQYNNATQTNAMAHAKLGNMLENGRGVEKNLTRAVKQYKLGINKGDKTAYAMLANMYEKSDAPDDVTVYVMLGDQYDKGDNIPQDKEKAVKFYAKAKQLEYAP